MSAGHTHEHGSASRNQRKLTITLLIAASYMLAEFIGGLTTGSLALLADAGHMLSDVAALALSLWAIRMAGKPATGSRTYGFHRTEILAALANAVTLICISLIIVKEGWIAAETGRDNLREKKDGNKQGGPRPSEH